MLIGMDATPLLGPRTGVGRYVSELAAALVNRLDDPADLRLTAFTLRGRGGLDRLAPPGASVRSRPVPARLLQAAWARSELPSIRAMVGRVTVFHGTNFVLPPVRHTGGVVTIHDLWYLRHPGEVTPATRRYRELVPRSLSRAAVVCTPSESVAEEVAAEYPQAVGRIVVTPLGVAPSWASAPTPSDEWLADREVRGDYVLFVGSVEPRKSLQTVVDAYRAAGPEASLPQLVLAGPAGWGPELDVTGLPEGQVRRLGRQTDDDLAALVTGARALIYPSRYEGFGLPLLEAFACGTPVIATDLPTTREVLGADVDLAQLFPVGDVSGLAAALSARPLRTPLDDARRRAVATRYTWGATADATMTAYERAVG